MHLTVKIQPAQKASIKALAKRAGLSMSDLVRAVIAEEIRTEKTTNRLQ